MAKKKSGVIPETAPKAHKERWNENLPEALVRGLEAAGIGPLEILSAYRTVPEAKVYRCTLNDGRRITVTFEGELVDEGKPKQVKTS